MFSFEITTFDRIFSWYNSQSKIQATLQEKSCVSQFNIQYL